MKKENIKNGVSLFSQSEFLIDGDPIEEIFALNIGDFISEHLISEDLAKKIGQNVNSQVKDKKTGLVKQLKELVSIYSLKNTLCVLSFNKKEEYAIYTSIAQSIGQMLEVEDCSIYLTKDFTKKPDVSCVDLTLAGSTTETSVKSYKTDENSIIADAYNTKETVTSEDIIAVPMSGNIKTVGVIVIKKNSKIEIKSEYVRLVESIATLFATSMTLQKQIDEANKLILDENSMASDLQHIRAELTASIGDLCDYQQSFVEHLANAVDTKGQYKVSHSKNTADLARLICKQLELNEKTSDLIYYAGLLQNIGKIALSEKVFSTNGKLSADELKAIQNHSNVGVNFLMNINFLSEVVPYIIYKSEMVDGSGKPEGLKGNSIPLGSRIIAVADAFSAMTSDRPYRKAISSKDALKIMHQETDKKWDFAVVDALSNVI